MRKWEKRERRKSKKSTNIVNLIRTVTEVVKESKTLVKEIDSFLEEAKKTKVAGFLKLDMMLGGGKREYYGEMFDYGDRIEIRQEVGIGVTPEVKYSGNKIYITFGDEKREYEVG